MLIKSRSLAALLAGVAACCSPIAAMATEQERQSYDMPAQDLGEALRRAADLADIELYASSRDLEGKTAPALKGQFTPREAVETLLAGSGLIARFDDRAVMAMYSNSVAKKELPAFEVTMDGLLGTFLAADIEDLRRECRLRAPDDLDGVIGNATGEFGSG